MHPVVRASLALAAAVAIVTVLFYATGFHRNYTVSQITFLVVAIVLDVAVVVWTLSKTAETNDYLHQLLFATGIGLLAGALIVAASLALHTVVFPNAIAETREAAIAEMEHSGMPADEVAARTKTLDEATATSQAIAGGVGTFFTSILTGAVYAIWRRRR